MKRYFFLLILLTLFVSTELKSQDNFHQLIENSGDAKKYPGANILVIFDSTYVRVKESGLSYAREHKLIKMLNDAGAKSFVLYTMDYDPQSANVEVLGAKIYRKNGEILEIGHGKIYDYPAPARMIYWGARQKAIEFGFLEPGDAIEIMTLRKGFTYALLQDDDDRFIPPMRGHFYDIVPFWVSNPTLEKAYCLEIPSDKPLQYQFYNGTAESKIVFLPYEKAYGKHAADFEDIGCRIPNIDKMKETIKYSPKYDIDDIVDLTIDYFRLKDNK